MIPSLHVYYKNTHLKQYHKRSGRGAGLRTETTFSNSYDLREIGFAANRHLPGVEKASNDYRIGAQTFEALQTPASAPAIYALATRAYRAS